MTFLIVVLVLSSVLLTSWLENKYRYNLFDFLSDLWKRFRGKPVLDAKIVIRVAANEAHLVENAVREKMRSACLGIHHLIERL